MFKTVFNERNHQKRSDQNSMCIISNLNIELQSIWSRSRKTVLFITHSISEAVLLSDRVAVMKKTPGEIVEVIDIDLPRPRTLAMRETAEFGAYMRRVRVIFEKLGILRSGH